MRAIVLLVTGTGCGDNLRLPEVPELVRAVDTNTDPDVVEGTLVATETRVEYVTGTVTHVMAYRDGSIEGSSGSVPGPLIEANLGDRLIGRRSTVRAVLEYEEPGKWMFHCSIPDHGMTADVDVQP